MLHRFTAFILRGRPQAMGVAFVCAFVPVISSISVLIAAFVTLRKGIYEGALVTCAGLLPYLLSYVGAPVTQTTFALFAISTIFISSIVTWLFAVILRQYKNWSLVLEVGAAIGVLAILLIHAFYPDIQNWWATQLTGYFNQTTPYLAKLGGEDGEVVAKMMEKQTVGYLKHFATGLIAASVLLNAVLQLFLARWWQAIIFNPGGLRKELYQIRLSYVAGIFFILGLISSYEANALSIDLMPVLYAVFCIAGLSILHVIFGRVKKGWIGIGFVYVVLFWFFPMSVIFVSIAGLIDTFFNFRYRLLKLSE